MILSFHWSQQGIRISDISMNTYQVSPQEISPPPEFPNPLLKIGTPSWSMLMQMLANLEVWLNQIVSLDIVPEVVLAKILSSTPYSSHSQFESSPLSRSSSVNCWVQQVPGWLRTSAGAKHLEKITLIEVQTRLQLTTYLGHQFCMIPERYTCLG